MLLFASILPWLIPNDKRSDMTDVPLARSLVAQVFWALSVFLKNFSALWGLYWLSNWWGAPKERELGGARTRLLFAIGTGVVLIGSTVLYFQFSAPSRASWEKAQLLKLEANSELPSKFKKHRSEDSSDTAFNRFQENALFERLSGASISDLYWGRQGVGMVFAATTFFFHLPKPAPKLEQVNFIRYLDVNATFQPDKVINFVLAMVGVMICMAGIAYAGYKQLHLLPAFALIMLAWFYIYLDTWEHHYVMLLPLTALLVATRLIGPRVLSVLLLCWAAPSLWGAMMLGYNHLGNLPFVQKLLIWVYFCQRGVGVLLLTRWCVLRIIADAKSPATPPYPAQ
jgi:hypothetical protein